MTHQQLFRCLYVLSVLKDHGRINRSDLVECFGIGTCQASLDLTRVTELWPEAMHYDPSEKAYLVGTLPFGVHWKGVHEAIRLAAEHTGQLLELLDPWLPESGASA
jgi:hypothetical protein